MMMWILQVGAAGAISLGGGAAIALGVIKFFGGVLADQIAAATRQKHAAEIESLRAQYATELERIRGQLSDARERLSGRVDTAVYRSKMQFDVEFKALQSIWTEVSEVRRRLTGLRPMFSTIVGDETPEEGIRRRANAMIAALNKLMTVAHDSEPFYPQEIFESIQQLIALCKNEQIEIEVYAPADRSADWWRVGMENSREAERLAEEIAAKTRAHLKNVIIVE